MKILYFTYAFPDGENTTNGIFTYRRYRELIDRGIEVAVVKPNPIIRRNGSIDIRKPFSLSSIGLQAPGFVSYCNYIKLPGANRTIGLKRGVLKAIQTVQPDLVHVHFVWDAFLFPEILEGTKVPYVVTAHGSDIHTTPFESEEYRRLTLRALKKAAAVIFVSKFLRKKAEEIGFDGMKVSVIPNGIDPAVFSSLSPASSSTSRTSGRDREATFGFIGSLFEVKRADLLPEIFSHISDLLPAARFLIVGDGPLRSTIEAELEKRKLAGKVELAGRVEPTAIPGLLRKMDALLLPSKNEGWPCVVLEAHAVGVPVVGSSRGGIPEAVGEYGAIVSDETGDIPSAVGHPFSDKPAGAPPSADNPAGVPPATGTRGPQASFARRFAEAAVEIVRDPPSQEGMVRRASKFTWKRIVSEEIEVYKTVLSKE